MVGASGAISGLMGAAFRFLFRPSTTATRTACRRDAATAAVSLAATLRNRRILHGDRRLDGAQRGAGLGRPGLTEASSIAWEAHLGGFYVGLLTFGFFDRPPGVTFIMMLRRAE